MEEIKNIRYDNIFIKKEDVNKWIGKYFPKKDLISVEDLLGCIEDLDSEIQSIKEEYEDYKENVKENYKYKW